ncbi:MAG TPA: 4-alpha-glucanotransferase [Bacteroidales bacterium]|nr:4-alpha-glucanotransferase [Bacteroidales bacterium]HRZ76152.1 4-alpha-glucanotransferase [Bacteroidales bacterium]
MRKGSHSPLSATGRSAGILMHPSSLPGNEGIGTLGEPSRNFLRFLKESGQRFWQVLPLGPTGYGDSPYQCFSSAAGNPYLIDLSELASAGWLDPALLHGAPGEGHKVDFGQLIPWKMERLRKAWAGFKASAGATDREALESFIYTESSWLHDFSLFMALKLKFDQRPWYEWPEQLRLRDPEALRSAQASLQEEVDFHAFLQYVFFRQWEALREKAQESGIRIIGDIPLYVARDSADAWAGPEVFLFDEAMHPTQVAGVPPDYFSATGQLWGNPVFDWDYLEHSGYAWWIERIRRNLRMADLIRIDHFRGLEAYWAVPFGEETAVNGQWLPARGRKMLEAVREALGTVPLIAEDLGDISEEVYALRDDFELPGMVVMQFAFDGNRRNIHLPYLHRRNSLAYTGTHDNDTLNGWLASLAPETMHWLKDYFGCAEHSLGNAVLRAALASVAELCIVPFQDWLGLDSSSRMNAPGTLGGNWTWRCSEAQLGNDLTKRIQELTEIYGRLGHRE